MGEQMNRLFCVFKDCFTNIPITQDIFNTLLEEDKSIILDYYQEKDLIGFSVIHENCIRLLCVLPSYQRKGIGRQILEQSEKLIQSQGYETAILGGVGSKLFIGAPTREVEWKEHRNYFFEQCGYTAKNGCLEMTLSLKNFNLEDFGSSSYPRGITFEYWSKPDKTELLDAVKQVDVDWVTYFQYDLPIYVAMEEGRCVGFTLLSFQDRTLYNNGENIVGKVGCVGVIPSKRNQGIGLAMVAHATNELKHKGCDDAYIHYTYLDQWYGKLGYKTLLWYWFGMKHLGDKEQTVS